MRCKNDTLRKELSIRIIGSVLFGKYRIISRLGSGSNSTVYLAEHLKLNVHRAIKCIPKCTEAITSFSSEAHLLKNLRHPGIPLIYDIDEDDAYLYIVEEYIQGESLEHFVLHHSNISQEFVIEIGIKVCDILDYLHHIVPYPILYQDLKPAHIIVCDNQVRIIDFGIASFYTNSNSNFLFFGTEAFAAPEVQGGIGVTPQSDLYSLGKVLCYLIEIGKISCSQELLSVIHKACATRTENRYETVRTFKSALEQVQLPTCQHSTHLIKNIIVVGSKHGIGTTHIAYSLVSYFNHLGYQAFYVEKNDTDGLRKSARNCKHIKEKDGIYYCKNFKGVPDYDDGIECTLPDHSIQIKDYGVFSEDITELVTENPTIFVFSGSHWDLPRSLQQGLTLKKSHCVQYICNYGNKSAARKYACDLGKNVYCFPMDSNPFTVTAAKETLFSAIFLTERRKHKFKNFIFRKKKTVS